MSRVSGNEQKHNTNTGAGRSVSDALIAAEHANYLQAVANHPDNKNNLIQKPLQHAGDQAARMAGQLTIAPDPDATAAKIDIELARLAIVAGEIGPFAVWAIARALDTAGRGIVPVEMLRAKMARSGVTTSRFYGRLQDGDGLYWHRAIYAGAPCIRLIGYEAVAARLVDQLTRHPDAALLLAPQNRPGAHLPVYVNLSGNENHVTRAVYLAWLGNRKPRPLSQAVIGRLFGVGIKTLWRWNVASEKLLTRQRNDGYARPGVDVPDHWQIIQHARTGRGVRVGRLPNTYHTTHATRQHPHRGTARAVRRIVSELATRNPADSLGDAIGVTSGGLQRRYFEDDHKRTAYAKIADRDKGAAFAAIGETTGRDGIRGVWELTDQDGPQVWVTPQRYGRRYLEAVQW